MSEAIAIKADQVGRTYVDPLGLQLKLEQVADGILAGEITPESADKFIRACAEITKTEMARLKIFKMTTRTPNAAMRKQWNID